MRVTKKEKMGNYICKIGKYDIRQIVKQGGISRGGISRGSFGKVTHQKGSCEARIYLGKKLIQGNVKDIKEAINKAFEMTCKEGAQQQVDKRLLEKHNLTCV